MNNPHSLGKIPGSPVLLTLGVKREPTKRRCLWTGDTEEQIGHDTQREILQRGGD